MRIYYTDRFVHAAAGRSSLSHAQIRALAVSESLRSPAISLREPAPASDADLALAHDPAYVSAVASGALDPRAQRRIGFPWSRAMVERSRRSVGATIAACRTALAEGCGINLAGGTHHAHRDFGEGFCVFNDAAVAARVHAEPKPRSSACWSSISTCIKAMARPRL